MDNVSEFLQPAGTEGFSDAEKQLSRKDLEDTAFVEGLKAYAYEFVIALQTTTAIGIVFESAKDLVFFSEAGERLFILLGINFGLAALSLASTPLWLEERKNQKDHVRRATDLLSAAAGDRPVKPQAALAKTR